VQHTTTTILRPFVWDYPGEPVPEETLTHPPSWSSPNLYQLLPSTMIHSILLVQTACLAIFLHNLSLHHLWSTSWSGALHHIFRTFLHLIIVFFSQHMPIQSQPVLLHDMNQGKSSSAPQPFFIHLVTPKGTSGHSNLTQGRITAAHGRFSRIRHVAPVCTPI